jgi:predicted O-methyltransferase YrrM
MAVALTDTQMKPTFISMLDYLGTTLEADPVYDWILNETRVRGVPEMNITSEQGRILNLLVRLSGAKKILEVGTLSGFSGVWMARALPTDGKLITCEVNPKHAELAADSFARAGVADKVELHVGPALETLATLDVDHDLDMAFIDADKNNNWGYFEYAEKHMRSGGLIIVDNIFLNGKVVLAANDYMKNLDAFNRHVFEKYGENALSVPFYKKEEDNLDGMLIVRVP